ncbi:hypothetical protein GCM10009582_16750 [Arthrobacter flavus]
MRRAIRGDGTLPLGHGDRLTEIKGQLGGTGLVSGGGGRRNITNRGLEDCGRFRLKLGSPAASQKQGDAEGSACCQLISSAIHGCTLS